MKTHLFSSHVLKNAPLIIINRFQKQGLSGSLCGYVRNKVTYDESKVTCKICLKKIEKRILNEKRN